MRKRLLAAMASLAAVLVATAGMTPTAASAKPDPGKKPANLVVGKQVQVNEPTEAELAKGRGIKASASLKVMTATASEVNLAKPVNYCTMNRVVSRTYNGGNSTAYVQIDLITPDGNRRTNFLSVAPGNGITEFRGVYGAYDIEQRVWNGTTYVQDEAKTNNNHTCKVVTAAVCSPDYPGYVQLTMLNVGTAHATVQTQVLQPGQTTSYDYPGIGTGEVIRYYDAKVGRPWAIASGPINNGAADAPEYYADTCV